MKVTIEFDAVNDADILAQILQFNKMGALVSAPVADVIETADDVLPPDFDVNGYPWDERIHSAGKTLNADRTWRQKRGVDPDLVAQIQSETAVNLPVEPPETETPPAPPPPAPMAPPPPADDDNNATFGDLMLFVSKLKAANKLSDEQFKGLYEPHDLASFAALSARPDLVPVVMKEVRQYA